MYYYKFLPLRSGHEFVHMNKTELKGLSQLTGGAQKVKISPHSQLAYFKEQGRLGDTELVQLPKKLIKALGRKQINPHSGLREYALCGKKVKGGKSCNLKRHHRGRSCEHISSSSEDSSSGSSSSGNSSSSRTSSSSRDSSSSSSSSSFSNSGSRSRSNPKQSKSRQNYHKENYPPYNDEDPFYALDPILPAKHFRRLSEDQSLEKELKDKMENKKLREDLKKRLVKEIYKAQNNRTKKNFNDWDSSSPSPDTKKSLDRDAHTITYMGKKDRENMHNRIMGDTNMQKKGYGARISDIPLENSYYVDKRTNRKGDLILKTGKQNMVGVEKKQTSKPEHYLAPKFEDYSKYFTPYTYDTLNKLHNNKENEEE